MPGFDGSGPMGQGPRTGGGFGYCPPGSVQGVRRGLGRGGMPWGGGRGFGRGRWFGGGRRWYWPFGAAAYREPTSDEALAGLRAEADAMRRDLSDIDARIAEIEGQRQGEQG